MISTAISMIKAISTTNSKKQLNLKTQKHYFFNLQFGFSNHFGVSP